MQSQEVQTTLTGALGLTGTPLVAFVGAGGKTTALQMLTEELAGGGSGVLTTTTTMMLASQLLSVGPLLLEDDGDSLAVRAAEALTRTRAVSLAGSYASAEKVRGLAPTTVDALWKQQVADAVVVEADGSRGLPLKAFGTAEPQLPSSTTTAVVLAGLDALGQRLDEKHVHRADLLAAALGVKRKTRMGPDLLGSALALQVVRVRTSATQARVVVLLNKADDDQLAAQGASVSEDLLRAAVSSCGQPASGRPDLVVVGSLLRRTYRVFGASIP